MLAYIAYYLEILPIIFYLVFIKRNRGEGLWVIWLYSIISFATEYIFLLQQKDAFYVYTSFSIFELVVLSFFFYSSLKNKILRYIPVLGALIFSAVFIFYMFTYGSRSHKKDEDFDSISASIEGILVILYCIILLYEQIKDPEITFVYYTKKFWIIIAFFLYFSSTLFLFLFASSLTKEERIIYWSINNVFDMIKNILLCISFMIKKNNKSYTLDSQNLYA